jgi:hypothetical protein
VIVLIQQHRVFIIRRPVCDSDKSRRLLRNKSSP